GLTPLAGVSIEPIPGPATGTQTITIGTNVVNVVATFSPPVNPIAEDEIFFAMAFEALFPTDTALINYSPGLLSGADYSVLSYSCTRVSGPNSCGAANFTQSFVVVFIPEPSTLSLLALGTLGAAFFRHR